MHRVDPGRPLEAALSDIDSAVRARALRCAGEVGRLDLLPANVEHLNDEDPACAFWAAWSGVLLGDRGPAFESLRRLCVSSGPNQQRALQLALKILSNEDSRALLNRNSVASSVNTHNA